MLHNIFLEMYFGEDLLSKTVASKNIFDAVVQSAYFYFILAFVFLYVFFVILFFIAPLFRRKPEKMYKRYLQVREEMQKIDDQYVGKKLTHEDYIYAQFNYAKEYEFLITKLSIYPEYKQKLQSYKVVTTTGESEKSNISKAVAEQNRAVTFLYDLLLSHAKYYNIDEVRTAILDEGYSNEIAKQVIFKLASSGVIFGVEVKTKTSRVANIVNSMFAKTPAGKARMAEVSVTEKSIPAHTIDINKIVGGNQHKPKQIAVSVSSEDNKTKNNKQGIFAVLKEMIGFKERQHTAQEINDIFSDIEQRLKEKG